jgi:hypothetical protein
MIIVFIAVQTLKGEPGAFFRAEAWHAGFLVRRRLISLKNIIVSSF